MPEKRFHLCAVWFLLIALPAFAATNHTETFAVESHQRLLNSTVRLRIAEGNMIEYGSGTVVERIGSRALVVTCAHIFDRTTCQRPVQVTDFVNGAKHVSSGVVLALNQKWDVALVRVDGIGPVPPIPLAARNHQVRVGESVLVAGCDDAGSPRCLETQVTAINRFYGRPNLEVAAIPRDGRSGGGLVTADFRLIGVCNGINTLENEGLYAGVLAVHQLAGTDGWMHAESIGQSSIASVDPSSRNTSVATLASSLRKSQLESTARGAGDDSEVEVICIVRPKNDPAAPSEVIELSAASSEFLRALRQEQSRR